MPLGPLNVLIGPNGSGKSNVIEAIGLLRSATGKLAAPMRGSGGISEWIGKGDPKGIILIEAAIAPFSMTSLRHRIKFGEIVHQFFLVDESIEKVAADGEKENVFYYRFNEGSPLILVKNQ